MCSGRFCSQHTRWMCQERKVYFSLMKMHVLFSHGVQTLAASQRHTFSTATAYSHIFFSKADRVSSLKGAFDAQSLGCPGLQANHLQGKVAAWDIISTLQSCCINPVTNIKKTDKCLELELYFPTGTEDEDYCLPQQRLHLSHQRGNEIRTYTLKVSVKCSHSSIV